MPLDLFYIYVSKCHVNVFYTCVYIPPFPQILMNVQWIQAHVAQEPAWTWMAPTGVSAQPATTSMRKPVKVQHHKSNSFYIMVWGGGREKKSEKQKQEFLKQWDKCTQRLISAYMWPAETSCLGQLCWSALEEGKLHHTPIFSLSHTRVVLSQNTWIVYTVGLMKRYSGDFNTFLLCALFLEAGRNRSEFSASAAATAAGYCDKWTCNNEAIADSIPSLQLFRLHSDLSYVAAPSTYWKDFMPAAVTGKIWMLLGSVLKELEI